MQKKRILLCALLMANTAFIWGNSMLPAEMSAALSRWVFSLLGGASETVESVHEGTHLLRKVAHFLEFCSLGVLSAWLLSLKDRDFRIPAAFFTLFTACVDETIQLYAQGRGSSLKDVWIDFAGALLGIIIVYCISRMKNRRKIT